MPKNRTVIFRLLGILLAAPALFFAYYTVRLIYVNLEIPGAAAHRQAGMYIGAVVFPLAAIAFGWLSVRCFRNA